MVTFCSQNSACCGGPSVSDEETSAVCQQNNNWANIEFRAPYSQRHLFNAIPDTYHNSNPTNLNHNSKGNPNPTDPTNPNTSLTRYRCEYGTLNSMFANNINGTAATWHGMAREIGRRITTITENTEETTFLFQCLSMALQRENAVSFKTP